MPSCAVQILLDDSLQRYRRKQSLHAGFEPALADCKPNRNGAYVFLPCCITCDVG